MFKCLDLEIFSLIEDLENWQILRFEAETREDHPESK